MLCANVKLCEGCSGQTIANVGAEAEAEWDTGVRNGVFCVCVCV